MNSTCSIMILLRGIGAGTLVLMGHSGRSKLSPSHGRHLQVARTAADNRDGVAKPSRLATAPEPKSKSKVIEASKGLSAMERARKKRKGQQEANAAADPLSMLDDMFKDEKA